MNSRINKLRKNRYIWSILDDSTKTFFAAENWLVLWGYTSHGQELSIFTINHMTGWVQNTCTEAIELKR